MDLTLLQSLAKESGSKIVLLVMDGLGGLPMEPGGKTALETAATPNLDRLAAEGICGLHEPVGPGITPGSGPAHLGVFGYDPVKYQVGRGVLAASGIGFDLQPGDICARGNFCTVDENGLVSDRRAGRIKTEICAEMCKILTAVDIPGVEVFFEPVQDYRFLLVLRGEGLGHEVEDTDPQDTGKAPLEPEARTAASQKTAQIASQLIGQAKDLLREQHPANMLLLRGFSERPNWPQMQDVYGVNPLAIAVYPMYRGLAKLIGMQADMSAHAIDEEFTTLEKRWAEFDFFYVHIKPIDSSGEDGDFDRKVSIIEEVDAQVPRLTALNPDVIVVTGDHSTPAVLKYHGWHPVPALLWSNCCRTDTVREFGERACMAGGLGPCFPAVNLMPLALANARRLEKFGA